MNATAARLPYHYSPHVVFQRLGNVGPDYVTEFMAAVQRSLGVAQPNVLLTTTPPFAPIDRLDITSVSVLTTALPQGRRQAVDGLATQLKAILRASYPLQPGEIVSGDDIGVLAQAALGATPGAVVYTRQTDRAAIHFILDNIRYDIATTAVDVRRNSSSPREVGRLARPTARTLALPQGVSVAKDVASNLAFALPPPWGPVAAAGLSFIFGVLFGGGGGQAALLDDIKQMLNAVVSEIEGFLTAQQYHEASTDFSLFFNVTCLNAAGTTDTWSLENVRDVVEPLLVTLHGNVGANDGTLLNRLNQICDPMLLQPAVAIDRELDMPMAVIFSGVTAIVTNYYLIARLSAQMASFYGPGQVSAEDDKFQKYLGDHRRAVIDLNTFINGSSGPEQGDTAPETQVANAASVIRAGQDRSVIPAEFADAGFNVSTPAAQFGWATAMARFVAHRKIARLAQIGPVAYYDDRNTFCDSNMGIPYCSTSGTDGYVFTDTHGTPYSYSHATDRWTSGCCNQNDHEQDYRDDVQNQFYGHFDAVLDGLTSSDETVTTSYADDMDTIQLWRDRAAKLMASLPPVAVPNTITLAETDWGGTADSGSDWEQAISVAYAVAVYSNATQVPSVRNDWSTAFAVKGRNKPHIRNLPPLADGNYKAEIWRLFSFHTSAKDPTAAPGVPTIVGIYTDPTTTDWTDADPALAAARRRASAT
jgi:hypothetical protein